jgi:enoyl-CoA hydratase/carnithine racemase
MQEGWMAYKTLEFSKDGAAAIVKFHRPERRNAISIEMMHEIEAVLGSLSGDPSISGIIFTGGNDVFSAGVDLNTAKGLSSGKIIDDYMKHWRRLNRMVEDHDKPIISAIEGFCYTGGLEFALACDLRVAAKGSTFAITSSRIGTVAGAGGTQRLPRLIGIPAALDMMLAGEPFDSEWAFRVGLINRLTETGRALDEAKKMVELYSTRAPLSLRFIKRAVYAGMQMPLAEAIEFESFIVNTVYGTADKLEGISAFLEKRPAKFRGE